MPTTDVSQHDKPTHAAQQSGYDQRSDSFEGLSCSQEDIAAGLAADASWGNFAEDGCVEQKLLDELTTKGAGKSFPFICYSSQKRPKHFHNSANGIQYT